MVTSDVLGKNCLNNLFCNILLSVKKKKKKDLVNQ